MVCDLGLELVARAAYPSYALSETENALLIVGAWFAVWIGLSLVYRVVSGKPIVYRQLSSVQFRETSVSGNSNRTWYTKVGGARNCLVVQLTDGELDIHPFVPFNWFFFPEIYGLEFRVPIAQISSVEYRKNFFAHSLQIEFTTPERRRESVSLVLMRAEKFIETLRANPLFHGTLPEQTENDPAGV